MSSSTIPSRQTFRKVLGDLLALAPKDLIAEHRLVELEAHEPPWIDSGLEVRAGDQVTVVLSGRIFLNESADLWLDPSLQVWSRVGGRGPIERGSRASHTFTCRHAGAVELGNVNPAEWVDTDGNIAMDPALYAFLTGGTTVALIRWADGVDPLSALTELSHRGDVEGLLAAEVQRLKTGPGTPPRGWHQLWYLGPSEVFAHDEGVISCSTSNDFAIICRDVDSALTPETTLSWEWKVDSLPSAVAENTFPTHDYLSIAVEFDDGQDLTYQWSATLEPETSYRCPLPHWSERETHLVVRSGPEDLGRWVREERDVFADRARAIGGPDPTRIRAVWLIAVSFLQHGEGRCAYRSVTLSDRNQSRAIT
jgi:hypothetical protein